MTDISRVSSAVAGRYTVERELGAGGMATVYLAHDVRHDRKVALKVLRPELSAILGGERFLAEIKTIANLQHPHILPLHDSGEADGLVYYVMPYVEGESLRDRLSREKQLPVEEAIRIAREVADALQYAHQHGIIHRDIKPENILLHGGHAMVADFGIALAASRSDGGTRMTETGMSLGTPHYMAPEQAMGEREITPKADIYALGCVLYEMLTAEPPFVGATAQAIIARVMTEEPRSLTLQRKTIPPHVEAAVAKALEKLPADRFASAAAFGAALGTPTFGQQTVMPRRAGWLAGRRALPWAVTALAVVVAALALRRDDPVEPRRVLALALPENGRYVNEFGPTLAVTPDGGAVVYTGSGVNGAQLFLRRFDNLLPTPIAGTAGAMLPAISPDGRWVAFVRHGQIFRVPLGGGAEQPIVAAGRTYPLGIAWGAGDVIVWSVGARLMKATVAGGTPEVLAAVDSTQPNLSLRWPVFLPDGSAVLVTRSQGSRHSPAIVDVRSGDLTVWDAPGSNPYYIEPGFVLLGQSSGIVTAMRFDRRRRALRGEPLTVLDDVDVSLGGDMKFSLSQAGVMVRTLGTSGYWGLTLTNRERGETRLPLPDSVYANPAFSPDGRRIAVTVWSADITASVRVYDLRQATFHRLPSDSSLQAVWSPDGRSIALARVHQNGDADAVLASADGSGPTRPLLADSTNVAPAAFGRDGRSLIVEDRSRGEQRLGLLDLATRRLETLSEGPWREEMPALSPDGRFMAYVSVESGLPEIYVRPFPRGTGKWLVSVGGGTRPRWRGDEIFYIQSDRLLVARVRTAPAFSVVSRDTIPLGPRANPGFGFDVTADGRTFVMASTVANDLIAIFNPMARIP
jgi:serine/threonine-protein kinase